MDAKCLVRGSINIDEYFHVKSISRPGETISSSGYECRPGGKGANQAVAIAKAGGSVDFIGIVGPNGKWLIDELRDRGVGVNKTVIVEDTTTGRAMIQVAEDGENSIVLHHAANHIELPPPTPESLRRFTHLLLQNESPLKSTTEYLCIAHELGFVTIMNPSPLPTPEQTRGFPWGKLNWLIVNEGEARDLLTSVGGSHSIDAIELVTPFEGILEHRTVVLSAHAIGSKLASHPTFKGVNIICTLGAVGLVSFVSLVRDAGRKAFYLPASKLDGPVVDTTGAGDCFTGYFVSGLMSLEQGHEEDLIGVLNTSIKAAGICVQRRGTIDSIPLRGEVSA
ncbi:Ribokinase-like protein [Thelephora terrestris]|uniref:Ribokinase n=1 Tax=Thelephora terrestris TaxID=56493 RepID=A0A9P6L371_9AGAM|nr:Ribokinase-like protein [Thelephora terrestris]